MKCEWKEVTVADLGIIVTGKTPLTKNQGFWNGQIPFITPKDIQGTKHILQTERKITNFGLESVKGAILPPMSICVSCIGNIGYTGMTTKYSVSNQQINSIIVNEENDAEFVYYLMRYMWPSFKNYEGQSTALSILNKSQFSKIAVLIPNKSTQEKISAILSVIDDKIELNNAINNNLEQQAQALYQKLFGNVDLTKKQGVLAEICSYSKDRIAVSELSTKNYFSTENLLQGKKGAGEATSLPTTTQTTACYKGDTLISNIRPYFKKILYCEGDCGCSPDVLCFTPVQPRYSAFLFSTLYADNFFDFMVAGSKGTKMPRGDKQQIMTYPIVIPSDEELEVYNSIAFPILTHIHYNRCENKRLVELCDTLLPRLMSGEIDVSDINI